MQARGLSLLQGGIEDVLDHEGGERRVPPCLCHLKRGKDEGRGWREINGYDESLIHTDGIGWDEMD